eukprot:TRINITY_DN6725_c0_g2_i1.p1 TRINITY_DN6725_c0_g2~~TRINITY_DN6725_c0_g2_i1.p1  ORF type:complete len:933 (+),score=214.60 TRINITY_DN6725_c0_g2_i1:569-3367(+)
MANSLVEMESLDGRRAETASNVSGDDDELMQMIPKEISAKQLMMYLAGDIQRTRNYRTMPFYFIFLASFTCMVIAVNMANLTLNPDFYFNKAAKEAMKTDDMYALKDRSSIWTWLRQVSANLWLRTPKGASVTCGASFEFNTQSTIDPARSSRSVAAILNGVSLDECCAGCFDTPDCVGWVYDNSTAMCTMYEGVSLMENTDPDLTTGISKGNGRYTFFPITLFVVRQWRVLPKACDLSEHKFLVVPTSDRINIDGMSGCVNSYAEHLVTTDPFGDKQQFVSELTSERRGGPPPLGAGGYLSTATDRRYNMKETYAMAFPYTQNYETISSNIDQLQEENWLDGQTRAVAVDAIFFNPELNTFVHFTCMLEFFVTGALIVSARSTPFHIWSFATPAGGALFAVDILVIICVVVFALETYWSKRQFRKISWVAGKRLSVWEAFELANTITFFFTYYARGKMWHEGYELFQSGHIAAGVRGLGNCTEFCEERVQFTSLAEYSSQSYTSASWFAPSIILAYLRLFKFLQYNVRLNALSETIKEASGDLVGLCLIFLIVGVGYSVAGTLLFADEFASFQTFFSTTSYLVRLIFTGDMSLWDDMTRVSHPVIVAAYMLSWFVICWLVLLNMILAVIAGAFSVVQENMVQARRSGGKSIATDMKNYIFKYLLCCPQIHETGDPETKRPSKILYYFQRGKSEMLKQMTFSKGWGSRYISRRMSTLIAIKEYYEQRRSIGKHVDWEEVYLTEKTLSKITRWARSNGDEVLNNYEIERTFNEAMTQTMADQVALRMGERSVERMMAKIDDFHQRLEMTDGAVGRLHSLVEEQRSAINGITAQSSVTAKTVDKMGARVKQAVDSVTESAHAVSAVVGQQDELLITTQDIAAALEAGHQSRATRHRRLSPKLFGAPAARTPPPRQVSNGSPGIQALPGLGETKV